MNHFLNHFTCFLLVLVLFYSCSEKKTIYNIDSVKTKQGTDIFQPDFDNIRSNYNYPAWFQDGKFGIFIHWGAYSVPAYGSEWYPRDMYLENTDVWQHHRKMWGDQTKFGYKDFIPMFTADRFNADQWADLFKASGATYVVPVAEHHDGFSMYNSELNSWNSVAMGPRKDIIGLLKEAIVKRNMVFGLSTHRAENCWFFNGGMKFPSDVQDTTITLYGRRLPEENKNPDERFLREFLTHTYELIDKYQPQLIWFDWTVQQKEFQPYMKKFMAYYYNNSIDWGKEVVVNTKYGYPEDVQVWDVERGKSEKMKRYPWQTDTSVGKESWSYIDGEVFKSAAMIVHDLVDIVSKNGNLLLNIGPKADGSIPDEVQQLLRDIGSWLKVNGEAIYGTRPWIKSSEGVTSGVSGSFSDNEEIQYTPQDIRFTTKGNYLYAIALAWPDKEFIVKSLCKSAAPDLQIKKVSLLGSTSKIDWKHTTKGLEIKTPAENQGKFAYAFKIELEGSVMSEMELELTADNQYSYHGYIFNHSSLPGKQNVGLLFNKKKVETQEIAVAPLSRQEFVFNYLPSNGIYGISITNDEFTSKPQVIAAPATNLAGEWKFRQGNDDSWKNIDVDDSSWEVVILPANWINHSKYRCLDCWGWFRKTIDIPLEWKGRDLVFPMGKIDDADETYLNGEKIGSGGGFPPNYSTAFDKERRYVVPASKIKFGQKNVIAVKVYNGESGGGIAEEPLGPIEVK